MPAETTAADLELLLRRIIREEAGVTPVPPADKWRGGTFVLRPGKPGLQEKSWPIETFFHKVVMLRNRLRTDLTARRYPQMILRLGHVPQPPEWCTSRRPPMQVLVRDASPDAADIRRW